MNPRVLFLSGDLSLGGAAIFVLNICEGLRASGVWEPVAGVFYKLGEVGEQMRDAGHRIVGPFPECDTYEDHIEALFAACGELKPTVVVANLGGETYDFLRYVPEGVLRVGIVHSDQECVYRLVEIHADCLDLVVCVSRLGAEQVRMRPGLDRVRVESIACGVPISTSVRERGEETLRVLYLGRLIEEQKRASLLARIIRRTVERDRGIEWSLVGDGPDLPRVRAELADLHDSVTFTGPVDYRQVPEMAARNDVYFLCSDYEGLPLSLLESMAVGLVPVVSDLRSGISEVVHEGNGIKINPDREEEYVEAVIALAEDRARLECLSARAREDVIREYSVEAMTRRWEACLAGSQGAPLVEWRLQRRVVVPAMAGNAWYFHPCFRFVRKALKRLRKKLNA